MWNFTRGIVFRRLWGKETRFGRAARAGGQSVPPTSRAEDPCSLPRGFDARLAANVGRDGMALTSRLSTCLWDERGLPLGPPRASDRWAGGHRDGARLAGRPR